MLELILRNFAGVFSDYIFIDEPTIAYKHNIPVNKIYETLLFLSRKHIITYIPRKRTAYIFFPYSRMEPRHLTIHKEAYEVGKQRLELRINSMIDYVSNQTSCREAKILKYFGEENTCNCGHCDICVERKKASPSEKELADGILYMLSLKKPHIERNHRHIGFSRQRYCRNGTVPIKGRQDYLYRRAAFNQVSHTSTIQYILPPNPTAYRQVSGTH